MMDDWPIHTYLLSAERSGALVRDIGNYSGKLRAAINRQEATITNKKSLGIGSLVGVLQAVTEGLDDIEQHTYGDALGH